MIYAFMFLLCGLIGCTPLAYAVYRSWQTEQIRRCAEQVLSPRLSVDHLPSGNNTIGTIMLPGVTMREAATALATMGSAGPRMRDLLPEQCSHTQTNEDDGMELVLPVEEVH